MNTNETTPLGTIVRNVAPNRAQRRAKNKPFTPPKHLIGGARIPPQYHLHLDPKSMWND